MYVVLSLTGKLIGQTSHQRTSLTLTPSRGMNYDQKYNYTVADGEVIEHNTTRQSTVCPADAKTPERHRPDTGFFGFYRSVSQPQIYIFIKQTNSKETAAYLIKSAADSKHPPSLFTASERSYSGQLSLCVCTYVSYDKYDWKKNVIPKSHTYLNRLRFPSVFPPILHR